MRSSASKPSASTYGMFSAVSTPRISGTWPLNSSGLAERVALYSGYSTERKVCLLTSKATPRCVGCSSRSELMSIEVKP